MRPPNIKRQDRHFAGEGIEFRIDPSPKLTSFVMLSIHSTSSSPFLPRNELVMSNTNVPPLPAAHSLSFFPFPVLALFKIVKCEASKDREVAEWFQRSRNMWSEFFPNPSFQHTSIKTLTHTLPYSPFFTLFGRDKFTGKTYEKALCSNVSI